MASITVDGDLAASLSDLKHTVEVRDAGGFVLGFFSPAAPFEEDTSPYTMEQILANYDPEKSRERLARNEPGITKDELLRRVRERVEGQ